jgi:hypothetical protein
VTFSTPTAETGKMTGTTPTLIDEFHAAVEKGRGIIKGHPFEVGFECEAKLYRKEHPYGH